MLYIPDLDFPLTSLETVISLKSSKDFLSVKNLLHFDITNIVYFVFTVNC